MHGLLSVGTMEAIEIVLFTRISSNSTWDWIDLVPVCIKEVFCRIEEMVFRDFSYIGGPFNDPSRDNSFSLVNILKTIAGIEVESGKSLWGLSKILSVWGKTLDCPVSFVS